MINGKADTDHGGNGDIIINGGNGDIITTHGGGDIITDGGDKIKSIVGL
jgi:hypothetical protein